MAAGKTIRDVQAVFKLRVDKSGFQQAEASIQKIKGQLAPSGAATATGKSLSAGLGKVEKQFSGFGDKVGSFLDSLKGGFDGAGGSLQDLVGGLGKGGLGGALAGVGAGAAVVAAITAELVKLASASAKVADEADKMAQKTGVTTDEWQRLAFAGKLAGVSADELKGALQDVADKFEGARKGEAEDVKTLRALGLSWRDLKGQSPAKMLETVSDRLMKMPPTERIAASKKIGKSWKELLPLLSAGGKGLREAGDEAERFNLVMSDEQIKNSVEFNDNWTRTTGILEGFRNMLAKDLIPVMNEAVKGFVDWYKANKQIIDQRVQMIVEGIAGAYQAWGASLRPLIAAVDFLNSGLGFTFDLVEDIWVWAKGGDSLLGDAFTFMGEKMKEWADNLQQSMKKLIPIDEWLAAIDLFIIAAAEKLGFLAGPLGVLVARHKVGVASEAAATVAPVAGLGGMFAPRSRFTLPATVAGLGGGPGPQPIASGPNGEPIYGPVPSIPAPSLPAGPQSAAVGGVNVGGVSNSFVINGATDADKVARIVDDRIMSSWREVEASGY